VDFVVAQAVVVKNTDRRWKRRRKRQIQITIMTTTISEKPFFSITMTQSDKEPISTSPSLLFFSPVLLKRSLTYD
jgi:hypothetical protein